MATCEVCGNDYDKPFEISMAGATHSWGGYHWARTANPFTLKLGDNVSGVWDPYLVMASSDWSVAAANSFGFPGVLNTQIVPGIALRHRSPNLDCSPVSGTVQVCNKTYGKNGWLGLASIWASGSHITQGTAKLNDTYFNKSPYNTSAWKRLVMCQEVAHTFGLDHQDDFFDNANLGTCMDYTNDPDGGAGGFSPDDPSNEQPNTHDYEELGIIYSHLDSTTTIGSTAPSGKHAEIDSSDPKAWGREIHKSKDGRSSLFERDFGGGRKMFTFILWAR